MRYKKLAEELRKNIERDFKKPCPDFSWRCINCFVWLGLQAIEEIADDEAFYKKMSEAGIKIRHLNKVGK